MFNSIFLRQFFTGQHSPRYLPRITAYLWCYHHSLKNMITIGRTVNCVIHICANKRGPHSQILKKAFEIIKWALKKKISGSITAFFQKFATQYRRGPALHNNSSLQTGINKLFMQKHLHCQWTGSYVGLFYSA